MTDDEWDAIRRQQEREALMATIDDALNQTSTDSTDRLKGDFSICLGEGGVEAVYEFAEAIDWIRLPQLYPLVTEHFVHARVPPMKLTRRERIRLARSQRELAEKLTESTQAARTMPRGPTWVGQLADSLEGVAVELNRLAGEAESDDQPMRPGRSMKAGTPLALGLDALFWKADIPMTERCRLIAGVVSAFVEPVTGEQIRQRIKDLRRRPPSI